MIGSQVDNWCQSLFTPVNIYASPRCAADRLCSDFVTALTFLLTYHKQLDHQHVRRLTGCWMSIHTTKICGQTSPRPPQQVVLMDHKPSWWQFTLVFSTVHLIAPERYFKTNYKWSQCYWLHLIFPWNVPKSVFLIISILQTSVGF